MCRVAELVYNHITHVEKEVSIGIASLPTISTMSVGRRCAAAESQTLRRLSLRKQDEVDVSLRTRFGTEACFVEMTADMSVQLLPSPGGDIAGQSCRSSGYVGSQSVRV